MGQSYIYKIFRKEEWLSLRDGHLFEGSGDDKRDGFIHLSGKNQVEATLAKYFSREDDLVLAALDPAHLTPALKWEKSRGGALFPHYYGTLHSSQMDRHWPVRAQMLPYGWSEARPSSYNRLMPALFKLDPETAHTISLKALTWGLLPTYNPQSREGQLRVKVKNLSFPHPIMLAAGYDKNALAVAPLSKLGFSALEVGTITPRPQTGNPKPRLFRLTKDRAIINRFGFNSEGADMVEARLAAAYARQQRALLGINIGANRETANKADDYALLVQKLGPFADYITLNISSPNTQGLRDLQDARALEALIRTVTAARDKLPSRKTPVPLMLKLAPDLSDEALADCAATALRENIDGLILTNTTISRPDSLTDFASETGGLSGAPLMDPSTRVLRQMALETKGALPLIGVGGVMTGLDAYRKILAGASLVQLYSGMIFKGPRLVQDIVHDLSNLLEIDGFSHISDAIGAAL